MNRYDIWCEDYCVTEGRGTAYLLATVEANSFLEGVKKWKDSNPMDSRVKYLEFKNGIPYIWGCRLYDNEKKTQENYLVNSYEEINCNGLLQL